MKEVTMIGAFNSSRSRSGSWGKSLQVRIGKMQNRGVEIDRRVLRDAVGTRGQLAIADTTDQGKNRPTKVAKLSQGELVRGELRDVQIVWLAERRMTLTGYEQINDDVGKVIEYRQSWLVMLDSGPAIPEIGKRKISPNS